MWIQFKHVPDGRESELFGPFDFVELTYADLNVSKGGETQNFGCIGEDGLWYLASAGSGPAYTDVTIQPTEQSND